MTSCNNQWLSDYTYHRIRTRLVAEDALPAAGPVLPHLLIEEVVASGRPDQHVPEIPALEAERAGRTLIHVVATVNLTRRQGKNRVCQPALGRRCVWAQAREPGADSVVARR